MESSSSRATIGVIGPSQCLLLREQAKELGVDFFDLDHLRAFNKNWKQIKKWGNDQISSSSTSYHLHHQ
jgi:hypothetical protein